MDKFDLVLKNGTVVDVLNRRLVRGDVAICGNTISGIGSYAGGKEIDCTGQFILPGLIDTHAHVESSKLSPAEFAKAVIACGTTSIIADPHEIANVCGMAGVNYIVSELQKTPLNALVMLPSCVPATPFETNGAVIDAKTLAEEIKRDCFAGLGEFMNYPGVINREPECMAKIKAAKDAGKIIDGHVINVNEQDLARYYSAGIKTNHECITAKELQQNIDCGAYVHIREDSYAKNTAALVKGINSQNMHKCTFCTDDKNIIEITQNGHINNNLRIAVAAGLDPIDAVTIATLNAAACYNMKNRGAVSPSYIADIVIVDSLKDFNVKDVIVGGKPLCDIKFPQNKTAPFKNSVNIKPVSPQSFGNFRTDIAIDFVPRRIITKAAVIKGKEQHLNKLAVIERHKATGNIGTALIKGFGLEYGAIAQTVAHDSHNIIVIGANDTDMAAAAGELARVGGGITVVRGGKVIETLPLPIAGLMTDVPACELKEKLESVIRAAYSLGIDPKIKVTDELSFLALPVIPALRLTDKGLVDVNRFTFI